MRRFVGIAVIVFYAIPCVASELRLATVAEIRESWGSAHAAIVTNEVVGDFDGNGLSDAARIMRSEETGELGLYVILNEGSDHSQLRYLQPMVGLGIALAPARTYETLCGKGYDCPEGGSLSITLVYPGIEVFKPESASWILYWDGRTESFQSFGTSD